MTSSELINMRKSLIETSRVNNSFLYALDKAIEEVITLEATVDYLIDSSNKNAHVEY